MGVFLPSVRQSLGISLSNATTALSYFTIGYALMQIPAGYLLYNFSARLVIVSGLMTFTLGIFLQSFASSLFVFMLVNFIQGMGGAFAFIAAGVLIGQWFPMHLFLYYLACHKRSLLFWQVSYIATF